MNPNLEIALYNVFVNPVWRVFRRTTFGSWMNFVVYRVSLSEWPQTSENFWYNLNKGYHEMNVEPGKNSQAS